MAKKKSTAETEPPEDASKEEQIGFHKGSLMTLGKERQELVRIIGIVEQLLQMHTAALKELGVELDMNIDPVQEETSRKKPPIEDIL